VLAAFVAFFAAIFLMNGVLIWRAIGTNTGIVANEPYRKGLHYNDRIAAEERQAALGWKDRMEVTQSGTMALALTDKDGRPVTGLKVETMLGRPATNREDLRLKLSEVAPGSYQARTAPLGAGSWLVALEARKADADEPVYRLRRRLWFTP
jgi:nitrogen fixation protein FixH